MSIDIPTLITKLRSAPQKVGTFDRGDPKPLDEYRPAMTGEELEWLIMLAEIEAERLLMLAARDQMIESEGL